MAVVWKLPESVLLALHSMACLAGGDGERMSTRDIAAELGVSEHHLAKVHQRLAKSGLLRSVRGPRGGAVLARAADSITLKDIYEAMEGAMNGGHCLVGRPACSRRTCVFGGLVRSVTDEVRAHFAKTTLADIRDVERVAATAGMQDKGKKATRRGSATR